MQGCAEEGRKDRMAQLACVQCSVSSDCFLLILAAEVLAEVSAEVVGAH